jgi:hypothetical protein
MSAFRTLLTLLALHAGGAACDVAHYDDLAPEAIEAADTIRYDFPAYVIVIGGRNGTVYAMRRGWLPAHCRPHYEDEVTVIQ